MRQHNATFANFICRFGDEKVLLDYAYEIVIPAFTRDTYIRSYGNNTHYHFYEVELVTVDKDVNPPIIALAGRFIKDTELTRYQTFDDQKGLVRDEQRMRSAPSVFFLLILNNHRLIYFPETPHAPDLKSFKSTAELFLRTRHKEFIDEQYAKENEKGKITKKRLTQVHPRPTLEVIALTGVEDIEKFIRRYETLKQIDFRLVKPNDDIDAGEIFEQIREFSGNLNADRTKVTIANSDEGLNIESSIHAVKEATERGNQDVTLNGVDHEGNKLSGNNEHFQIYASLPEMPTSKSGLISALYGSFKSLVVGGAIKVPQYSEEQDHKIASLLERF